MAFYSALVRLSSAETISNTTTTPIPWDTAVHDDGSFWSAGSPTRLTVPSGVEVVVVTAYLAYANNANNDRWILIVQDGDTSNPVAEMFIPNSPVVDNDRVYAQSPPLKVSAGSYFEVYAWQASGGDLDVNNANTTFFSIESLTDITVTPPVVGGTQPIICTIIT